MLTAYLQFNNDELKCVIFSFELMLVFCCCCCCRISLTHWWKWNSTTCNVNDVRMRDTHLQMLPFSIYCCLTCTSAEKNIIIYHRLRFFRLLFSSCSLIRYSILLWLRSLYTLRYRAVIFCCCCCWYCRLFRFCFRFKRMLIVVFSTERFTVVVALAVVNGNTIWKHYADYTFVPFSFAQKHT